ncbi:Uncharacterised protein [Serratia fonticola]|uniref:Uncharacterized protein n=1 Tax=Serratia fonticola TaxID=47917 RepID=A0A4U9UUW8_SERFO|nr:Uncharacterised protein [Serratia fonticola]
MDREYDGRRSEKCEAKQGNIALKGGGRTDFGHKKNRPAGLTGSDTYRLKITAWKRSQTGI